ncbi:unnamed protein product [Dracunculus medinensis]|uniref:TPR_REGION domain-containing protein n=1 Tax=Dracunculus medinensis TaxID=318479 RepID=A0A0N4UER4_DRAME|nr:unnamed protein product [Dracunculus medinensis]
MDESKQASSEGNKSYDSDMYANIKSTTSLEKAKKSLITDESSENDDEQEEKKSKQQVMFEPPNSKKPMNLSVFDRRNFLIHQYYIRKDFNSCKALIKEILEECNELYDYPIYIRGKIAIVEKELIMALECNREVTNFINKERLYSFEKARSLRPQKSNYPREIGHIQFLLGNHKKAAEILLEAIKLNPSDTKAYYWRAMALYHIDQSDESATQAQECIMSAPNFVKSVEILKFLAELCAQKNEINSAIEAYKKALELESEDLDALVSLSLLYLKVQNDDQAFATLGKALSYDPSHSPSILTAGAIMQGMGDYDVALIKYR